MNNRRERKKNEWIVNIFFHRDDIDRISSYSMFSIKKETTAEIEDTINTKDIGQEIYNDR